MHHMNAISPSRRPNLFVFFVDQQRYDTTGIHGCPLDLTPHFDRFARAGTDVHHAFTPNPVCGPARACLQTGTYASTNGTYTNGIPPTDDLPHLADRLNHAGYHTAYFGKWHLVEHAIEGPVPAHRRGGYQHWLAANLLEMTSDQHHTRLWNNDDQPVDLPGYRSDALADATIRHVHDRCANHPYQPWMITTSFLEPHQQNSTDSSPGPDGGNAPYLGAWTPPDLANLPGTAPQHLPGYFAMIKRLDDALGRITDAL